MNTKWPEQSEKFINLNGIEIPLIAAPMAGGPSSPELVAAVSSSGGLGSIGGGYLSPENLEKQINEVKALTDRPFGVNLFITDPDSEIVSPGKDISDRLGSYADELGVELTPEISRPLFAALATDTGWFRFSSVTSETSTGRTSSP